MASLRFNDATDSRAGENPMDEYRRAEHAFHQVAIRWAIEYGITKWESLLAAMMEALVRGIGKEAMKRSEDEKVEKLLALFEARELSIEKVREVVGDKPVVWAGSAPVRPERDLPPRTVASGTRRAVVTTKPRR